MNSRSDLGRAIMMAGAALLVLGVLSGPRAVTLASGESPSGVLPAQILVGLFKATSVSLTCEGPWSLTSSESDAVAISPGATVALKSSGAGISWEISGGASERKSVESGRLLISVASPADGPFIVVKAQEDATAGFLGMSFRGSMIAMADAGGVLIANALDMEEYIQSVVGGEIPDAWPMEVNRAQAVAARSYAAHRTMLARAGIGRDYIKEFRSLGPADILIWASDQVYRGICEETPVTVTAAKTTRGQVLTYGGTPIAGYFHSDAGGMTEDPCYVWGASVPYLQPVQEDVHESPHASWTVSLSPVELSAALKKLGLSLGGQPEAIYGLDGGTSGRWFSVQVRSPGEKVTAKGTSLRQVLPQVKSTLFSAYMIGGGKTTTGSLSAGMCYSVATSDGVHSGVRLAGASITGQSGTVARGSEGAVVISEFAAEGPVGVVLQGMGWGHGVGLSQWGARGMALSGQDARTILMFYYPDTMLEQWW